jgi:hypothetical protein
LPYAETFGLVEQTMNASIASLIDSVRNTSNASTSQGLANVAEVVHNAYTAAQADTSADGEKRSEFNKWLIVAAAVVGAFFLLRGIRKLAKFAFVMFWVWFWVGGHSHHFF